MYGASSGDIHILHTPLFPWRNVRVLCITTIPSRAIRNDWSFEPNMNLKWLVWPLARGSVKDNYISIGWRKMVDSKDEHWHKMAPLQVQIYRIEWPTRQSRERTGITHGHFQTTVVVGTRRKESFAAEFFFSTRHPRISESLMYIGRGTAPS